MPESSSYDKPVEGLNDSFHVPEEPVHKLLHALQRKKKNDVT